jgi:hypothetical protein
MNIEIASNCLEILGRQGRILKLDFAAPLDELSIRRHRKALRAVHRSYTRHERDLQLILLEIDQVLSPYFVADDHTHPIRVLNGLTLTAIVARKAPKELGGLGLDVYARVLRELQTGNAFRQPIAGYPGLEALFADKVAGVIEVVARDRLRRGTLDKVDEVFYALSTGRKLESRKQSSAVSLSSVSAATTGAGSSQAACIQVSPTSEDGGRIGLLERNIEHIGSVFFTPAFVTDFAPRQEVATAQSVTAGQKANRKKHARASAGSYVDFTNKVKDVPTLSAATIKGIASAPGVLGQEDAASLDYLRVAASASAYRRSMHLGGPNIFPESAELHVRIFRAIGLTSGDVATLSADSLKELVEKAIAMHAVAREPGAKAA